MKKLIGVCLIACLGFGLCINVVSAEDEGTPVATGCGSPSCWAVM